MKKDFEAYMKNFIKRNIQQTLKFLYQLRTMVEKYNAKRPRVIDFSQENIEGKLTQKKIKKLNI